MFNPTDEQQKLIEVIKAKELTAIGIEAGPGCGKSSTLVMLTEFITQKGQMTCFGADIKKDLEEKLKDTEFNAKTFNGIGWSTMRKGLKARIGRQPTFEEMGTDESKYRKIADKAIQGDHFNEYNIPALLIPDAVKYDAIKFMHDLTRFTMVTMTNNTEIKNLVLIMATYGFEPNIDVDGMDEFKAEQLEEEIKDWGLDNLPAFMSIGEKMIESELSMTYTDQIYYTLQWGLRPWQTKYLFIDEAQDISQMELMLLSKCTRKGSYVVIVGDSKQAVMAFKGAMPGSFERVLSYFKAERFTLSATFRCSRRIVRLANMVKPELQPYFDNEGSIELKKPENLLKVVQDRTDADGEVAIIARTNAPLIGMCLELISNDIPATILGRDIGEQLNRTLDKISQTSGYTFKTLLDALDLYQQKRVNKMLKKMTDEDEIKAFVDTLGALKSIIERHTDEDHYQPATSLGELKDRISDLFSEDKDTTGTNIIKLMTAHKSKGMEFDTVLLVNDFRIGKKAGENRVTSNPIDETYVWFVAVTRAKNRLVVLSEKKPDWLFGHLPGDEGYELTPFKPATMPTLESAPIEEVLEEEPQPEPVAEVTKPELTPKGKYAKKWAETRIANRDFVVLDVETTDVQGEIIQLAVCDPDGNTLINTLIKPMKHEISQWVQDNIKITPDMVKDSPTFAEVYHTLIDVIKDKIVIAYNVKFDAAKVRVSSQTNGLPLMNHHAKSWQCAMLEYCKYNPSKINTRGKPGAWWKLEEALAQETINPGDANFHDAMFDIRATLAVMQSMAGVEITAFEGKDDTVLPFQETQTEESLNVLDNDPIEIDEEPLVDTIVADPPLTIPDAPDIPDIDNPEKPPFDTTTESEPPPEKELQSVKAEATQPTTKKTIFIEPEEPAFKPEDRIIVKATGEKGTVRASGNRLISIKLDSGMNKALAHSLIRLDKSAETPLVVGDKVKHKRTSNIGTVKGITENGLVTVLNDDRTAVQTGLNDLTPTQPQFKVGDRVLVPTVSLEGTVASVSVNSISVKFDDNSYMSYAPKLLELVKPRTKRQSQMFVLPKKPKKVPAKVRKQVEALFQSDDITAEHLDEFILLLQNIKQQKMEA